MNEYERQRRIAESTKKLYPPGTGIEFINMNDPYAPVPVGTRGTVKFDDARKIIPEQLPDFDLITGGFPCQSFSIAGARKGFDDTRGTLFFQYPFLYEQQTAR